MDPTKYYKPIEKNPTEEFYNKYLIIFFLPYN